MTLLQIPYPEIDPVFLEIGPLQFRWYGLMYVLGFVAVYVIIKRLSESRGMGLSGDDLYDLMFFLILGVMIGGRLGYVIFYDLVGYLAAPLSIVAIWQGGMSFHGGLLGVFVAARYATAKKRWDFRVVADLVSVAAPIGLGLGRIGNFINGELYGRPSELPWAMIFPGAGGIPRHPSQLYEALLEGVVLFLILRWLFRKRLDPGTVFWGLLLFYGLFRFVVEFVREADAHIGFDLGPLTRGQLLTVPMIMIGTAFMITSFRRDHPPRSRRKHRSRGL